MKFTINELAELQRKVEVAINVTGDVDRGLYPGSQEVVNNTLVDVRDVVSAIIDSMLSGV